MGPSQAGKTTLLASMDQACSVPGDPDDHLLLDYVGGSGTGKLSEITVATIENEQVRMRPTTLPVVYKASITATRPGGIVLPVRQHVVHLVIRDGPGGALFPTQRDVSQADRLEWEQELVDDGRRADTLVLCVDATDPRVGNVTQHLPTLLAEMVQPCQPTQEEPRLHRVARVLHLVKPLPPLLPQRRLKAERFLVLLTKVDQLVNRRIFGHRRGSLGIPREIATRLSPVQLACELIGETNLVRILNALAPTAELAVGVTSAWGFDPLTGRPFMEDDEPVILSNQSRSRRIVNWRPFGVRDALVFMTTGRIQGAVEKADRVSLGARIEARTFDASTAFDEWRTDGPIGG